MEFTIFFELTNKRKTKAATLKNELIESYLTLRYIALITNVGDDTFCG
jgi:hypothetical protein